MHCYQRSTEIRQKNQKYPWFWLDLWDLYRKANSPNQYRILLKTLSETDQIRCEWTRYFSGLMEQEYLLHHLTVTYKPYRDWTSSENMINRYFDSFYKRCFLPKLLNTRNYHRAKNRLQQPKCLVFVEEHEPKSGTSNSYTKPARLHHHAILAFHANSMDRIAKLIGRNTFSEDVNANRIMTSDLKQCSEKTVFYATKQLKKYPEFLTYPDFLKYSVPNNGVANKAQVQI